MAIGGDVVAAAPAERAELIFEAGARVTSPSRASPPQALHVLAAAAFASAGLYGLLQIPVHEGAHSLACVMAGGRGCALFYNIAVGQVAAGPGRAFQALAGPLAAWIILVGFTTASLYIRGAALAAAFAVVAVTAARPILLAAVYARSGGSGALVAGSDEHAVAAYVQWPAGILIGLSALLAGLCVAAVWRRLGLRRGAVLLVPVTFAGTIGTLVWLRLVGPALLPWR